MSESPLSSRIHVSHDVFTSTRDSTTSAFVPFAPPSNVGKHERTITAGQRACISAFPHLGDSQLGSSYASCSAYEGDWRETFLDGNRGNRSTVVDWKMEAVAAPPAAAAAAADGNDAEQGDHPEEVRDLRRGLEMQKIGERGREAGRARHAAPSNQQPRRPVFHRMLEVCSLAPVRPLSTLAFTVTLAPTVASSLPHRRLISNKSFLNAVGHLSYPHPHPQRRFFPPFSLCGYSFSLLADPNGNPRAANQGPAGGPRVEKGLSVYLTVLFEDELLDTPPWSGGGNGSFSGHGFPPPPLQLGPGHPWGADEEEEQEGGAEEQQGDPHHREDRGAEMAGKGEGSALRASGTAAPAEEDGDGAATATTTAASAATADGAAKPTAVAVKRDPHGLRRRRRRARTREGRTPVVSHVGDASAISRECCAAFSLTALNKDPRKGVTWVSSMKRDRFFPGRSSWGVHCLVPTSTFQVMHGFTSCQIYTYMGIHRAIKSDPQQ